MRCPTVGRVLMAAAIASIAAPSTAHAFCRQTTKRVGWDMAPNVDCFTEGSVSAAGPLLVLAGVIAGRWRTRRRTQG